MLPDAYEPWGLQEEEKEGREKEEKEITKMRKCENAKMRNQDRKGNEINCTQPPASQLWLGLTRSKQERKRTKAAGHMQQRTFHLLFWRGLHSPTLSPIPYRHHNPNLPPTPVPHMRLR